MSNSLNFTGDITVQDVTCGDITCEDVTCDSVTCDSVACDNSVTCAGVTCSGDASCDDITCTSVTTGDISISVSGTHIDKYTLLWTNESPTAAFETQTVTLTNKSNYDAFEIVYINYRNDQNGRTTVFVDGETSDYTWCHFVTSINESASMNVVGRYATNTATGLTFSVCYLHNMTSSSYSPNNDWLIPYKIYGIKEG